MQKLINHANSVPRIAVIIGSMKSGTTSLFHYLSAHPKIAASSIKEPGFFALDEVWENGLDWYFDLFNFMPDRHVWAMEASTDYTKSPYLPSAADRMALLEDVEFRFIYLIRHPLRRIESQVYHAKHRQTEIGHRHEEARDFSLDAGYPERAVNISRYAAQLDCYLKQFPKSMFYIDTFERLGRDANGVIEDMLRFLRLDSLGAVDTSRAYNTRTQQVRPNRAWLMLRRSRSLRSVVRKLFPARIRRHLESMTGSKVSGRYVLTPAEENRILRDLRTDLIRLREEFSIDIEGEWGIRL